MKFVAGNFEQRQKKSGKQQAEVPGFSGTTSLLVNKKNNSQSTNQPE